MKSVPEFIAIGEMERALQTDSVKERRPDVKFSAKTVTKTLDHNNSEMVCPTFRGKDIRSKSDAR